MISYCVGNAFMKRLALELNDRKFQLSFGWFGMISYLHSFAKPDRLRSLANLFIQTQIVHCRNALEWDVVA